MQYKREAKLKHSFAFSNPMPPSFLARASSFYWHSVASKNVYKYIQDVIL